MKAKLVLFFTRGVSIRTWETVGMLEREVALYRRLQSQGVEVAFLTYGDATELHYQSRLPGIKILCNRWNLPPAWYEYLLPWLHGSWLRKSDIIKTNQTNGADVALRASRIWHKPLVARCGYMWSEHAAREMGVASPEAARAQRVEAEVFRAARRVVVTTAAMAAAVQERIPDARNSTRVIPNYVDTDSFAPSSCQPREFQLVFVGRLTAQKNIAGMLEAVLPLPVRLLMIGDGELREELQRYSARMPGRIEWQPRVPNQELAQQLNRAQIFILPSHYEGHPKALLEAMSCGLPVIGANSHGIKEVLQHGNTGWLCNPDSASLRAGIEHLLANSELRTRLGDQARQYVVENFALDRVTEMELALHTEVIHEF